MGILAFLYYRHRKIRKQYHLKFKELMDSATYKQKASPAVPYSESELGFSQDLADTLLKKLEKFERNQEYKEHDMNLARLATKLNTNQKYVTKILAHYRGKGIIEYISDLKIDYIVEKLRNDKRFRNYKNKSLSDEAGFGSTQIFTKTFKNKVGLPPTV